MMSARNKRTNELYRFIYESEFILCIVSYKLETLFALYGCHITQGFKKNSHWPHIISIIYGDMCPDVHTLQANLAAHTTHQYNT